MTGPVALMDFITYLVTKIIFIKSNIGDPTLEIWLKDYENVGGQMIRLWNFFEDGRFFLFEVKVYQEI